MRFLSEIIRKFDVLILRVFLSGDDLRARDKEFNDEVGHYDNNLNTMIHDAHDSIDTKTTAVLQHVSIMIAVSGVLYSQAASSLFRYIFIAETLLYVVLTLFCLRLLMAQTHSSNFSDTQNATAKEAVLDLTAKFTFLISVALILTVMAELVIK